MHLKFDVLNDRIQSILSKLGPRIWQGPGLFSPPIDSHHDYLRQLVYSKPDDTEKLPQLTSRHKIWRPMVGWVHGQALVDVKLHKSVFKGKSLKSQPQLSPQTNITGAIPKFAERLKQPLAATDEVQLLDPFDKATPLDALLQLGRIVFRTHLDETPMRKFWKLTPFVKDCHKQRDLRNVLR